MQKPSEKSLARNDGELDLQYTLNKLSELLESAITIAKDNRARAVEYYEGEKRQLDDIRAMGQLVSEEGILEKNCTNALKLVHEATSCLDGPITALTRILQTKIAASSFDPSKMPVNRPVNIRELKD